MAAGVSKCCLRAERLGWPLGVRDPDIPNTSCDLDYQEGIVSCTPGLLFRNPTKVFCIKRVCVRACARARAHTHVPAGMCTHMSFPSLWNARCGPFLSVPITTTRHPLPLKRP